jgi:hypothetical protein
VAVLPFSSCGKDNVPVLNSILVFVPPVMLPVTPLAEKLPAPIFPCAVPIKLKQYVPV